MSKKLVAISLAVILVGMFSMVAMAQENEVPTLPLKPVLGTQMTFGLGWISYIGLDVSPLEVDFGGLTTITGEGIDLNTFGLLFKLDYYTPPKLTLYLVGGFFYDFSKEEADAYLGLGTEYLVNPNLFIYGDIAFVGKGGTVPYELEPGMTAGIKLSL